MLYAGSLIIPFAELQKQFEALHPDIKVNGEGHGSIQVLRQVSDIHDEADVLISADSQLIPMLLYQTKDPQTGKPYGTLAHRFRRQPDGHRLHGQEQIRG